MRRTISQLAARWSGLVWSWQARQALAVEGQQRREGKVMQRRSSIRCRLGRRRWGSALALHRPACLPAARTVTVTHTRGLHHLAWLGVAWPWPWSRVNGRVERSLTSAGARGGVRVIHCRLSRLVRRGLVGGLLRGAEVGSMGEGGAEQARRGVERTRPSPSPSSPLPVFALISFFRSSLPVCLLRTTPLSVPYPVRSPRLPSHTTHSQQPRPASHPGHRLPSPP